MNPAEPRIVQPPCRALLEVSDALEEAIGSFLDARSAAQPSGRWEAPFEAWAISNLMVRNVEAVIALARLDEVMVPAAWINTRAVFDAATRILWLLAPPDRFDAECRWIALLREFERFHTRMASAKSISLENATAHLATAQSIKDFHVGVESRLPEGYRVSDRIPSNDEILRELGIEGMYQLYIEGSQYMHAAMPASGLYRQHLGIDKNLGEFTSTSHWILPMRTCWICFHNAGSMLVSRLDTGTDWKPTALGLAARIDQAFQSLAEYVSSP